MRFSHLFPLIVDTRNVRLSFSVPCHVPGSASIALGEYRGLLNSSLFSARGFPSHATPPREDFSRRLLERSIRAEAYAHRVVVFLPQRAVVSPVAKLQRLRRMIYRRDADRVSLASFALMRAGTLPPLDRRASASLDERVETPANLVRIARPIRRLESRVRFA